MVQTQEEHLVAVFRRTGSAIARGIVTYVEFTNRVFDEFASLDRVYSAVIPALWELVPVDIREEFAATIHRAVAPGFRYHAFHFGGGRPMTDEELRRDADLRTARVQAWAVEFVRFRAGMELHRSARREARMSRRVWIILALSVGIPSAGLALWYGTRPPEPPVGPDGFRYDPIEDDPQMRPLIEAADREARQVARPYPRGGIHAFWRKKKEILREKHGIIWRSPAEMNQDVAFD